MTSATAPVNPVRLRLATLLNDNPLAFQLLLLFVFFLPLLTVQIPSSLAGFSINPARLAIILCLGIMIAERCIHPHNDSGGVRATDDRLLWGWLVYLALSVVVYYVGLPFGVGERFASAESFFRSWRGKPIAQIIALVTYGVAPYLLVRRYATDPRRRRVVEGAFIAAILLLVVYGYFQQFSYRVGLPVTGRLLYEGGSEGMRVAGYSVGDVSMLRFYSLGGEPREYGSFAIAATVFYAAWATGHPRRRRTLIAGALALSVLLTMSTSAFTVLAVIIAVVVVDAARQGFVRVGTVVRVTGILAIVVGLIALTGTFQTFFNRTLLYFEAFRAFGKVEDLLLTTYVRAQAPDLAGFYYLIELPNLAPHRTLFGFGFGNYGSGLAEILQRVFAYDLMAEGSLEESRVFLLKILVETGVVGVLILFALFFRTLRHNRSLIDAAPDAATRARQIGMRYAYAAFFVSGMLQISFYHFIIMGLIEAEYWTLRHRGLRPSA